MRHRDYIASLKRINQEISKLESERKDLILEFRRGCKHELTDISLFVVDETDEYDKVRPEWRSYKYACNRCGETLTTKTKFDTINDIRVAFAESIEKEYKCKSTL